MLVVVGLREDEGRIRLVTKSPNPGWRAINVHLTRPKPSSSGPVLVSGPAGVVTTLLRCRRRDARPLIIATSRSGLDARYDNRTEISAKRQERDCEIEVIVTAAGRPPERTVFRWRPGMSLSDAPAE